MVFPGFLGGAGFLPSTVCHKAGSFSIFTTHPSHSAMKWPTSFAMRRGTSMNPLGHRFSWPTHCVRLKTLPFIWLSLENQREATQLGVHLGAVQAVRIPKMGGFPFASFETRYPQQPDICPYFQPKTMPNHKAHNSHRYSTNGWRFFLRFGHRLPFQGISLQGVGTLDLPPGPLGRREAWDGRDGKLT